MSTILITGGAGFIGSNFARFWLAQHPADDIIVLDVLNYAGNEANLADVKHRITFVRADIGYTTLIEDLLRARRVDMVVNFAAESHNSLAVLQPERFFQTNVMGTQGLLEAARRAGVGRFHHVSTCEVYGDLPLDSEELFTETSPYRPRTPYSASKACSDHAVRCYAETYGLPVTISNCANNYGPYQFPEKVIPVFATKLLQGLNIPVYQSSEHRREWIHVVDHCRAIERILESGTVGETYHVGTGVEASVAQIATLVLSELGVGEDRIEVVADRPGHDRRYILDSQKIRRELGWAPVIDFEEGVRETVRWYEKNRAWWAPLLEKRLVQEENWAATVRDLGLADTSR
jgi:dTDP-glucose 4,6-dehydratase